MLFRDAFAATKQQIYFYACPRSFSNRVNVSGGIHDGPVYLSIFINVFDCAHNHIKSTWRNILWIRDGFPFFGPRTLGAGAKTRVESSIKKSGPIPVFSAMRSPYYPFLEERAMLGVTDAAVVGAGAKTRVEARMPSCNPI